MKHFAIILCSIIAHNEDRRFDPLVPPSSASYVKLVEAGYLVEKPFPKIYLIDETTVSNRFTREYTVLLPPDDEVKILALAVSTCNNGLQLQEDDDLSQEDHVVETTHGIGLMVTYKVKGKSSLTCFIEVPKNCEFLSNINSVKLTTEAIKGSLEITELKSRMNCG